MRLADDREVVSRAMCRCLLLESRSGACGGRQEAAGKRQEPVCGCATALVVPQMAAAAFMHAQSRMRL